MSAEATFWAWDQAIKPASAKLVLLCLANCHNDSTGQCNPSLGRIAEMTGLNIKTVPDAISKLENSGLIVVERRVKRASDFVLGMPRNRAHGTPENGITRKRGQTTPENGSKHTPKSGKEPKREPKKKLKGGFSPEEIPLPDGVSSEAWGDWCEYRRERKPLITKKSATLTLNLLAQYDTETQREMVNSSIRSSYQGVFAPKNYNPTENTGTGEVLF